MSKETVDCLLPTGILVQVQVAKTITISDLKIEAWKAAAKLPLYAVLKKPDSYGVRCVNVDGEVVEPEDDQPFGSARTFRGVVKIFPRRGDKAEQRFNMEIGSLIGKNLTDFDNMRDTEVNTFRRDILATCLEAVESRAVGGRRQLELYRFPPNIDETPLPPHIKGKLAKDGTFHVKVKVIEGSTSMEFSIKPHIEGTPKALIQQVLSKKARNSNQAPENPDDYVLKVSGREEYLLGDMRLSQYKYIRQCLAQGHESKTLTDITVLILRKRQDLDLQISKDDTEKIRSFMKRTGPEESGGGNMLTDSLWFGANSNAKFSVKIVEAFDLILGKLFGVGVVAAIYLGDRLIGQEMKTRYTPPADNLRWNDTLEFEISLKDLPRDCRLCLAVHGVWANPLKIKKKKDMRNEFPLAWVNIPIFDYKGVLRSGSLTLTTWPYDNEYDPLLNPLGTTMLNPVKNKFPTITIEFDTYSHDIKFPEPDLIGHKTDGRVEQDVTQEQAAEIQDLEDVVHRDPLHELTPREIQLLRKYKYYVKNQPLALGKCLRAVDWTRNEAHHEVADMLRLWAAISPEDSLDLLDAAFADASIRAYAVQALSHISDDKLLAFLLQLTQVLKYENYLNNALANFLLKSALRNQRLGHFFFWYLKSEMHLPEVSVRYGLLLEAYCRGCGGHMIELTRQANVLAKLVKIADSVKPKGVQKPQKVKIAKEQLDSAELGQFLLPLDPTLRLGGVDVEKVKVMDSKKLPLWLPFHNADNAHGGTTLFIFKSGDDIRQDMLVLQLIRLMDQLWQANGLDFHMHPYGCLSMGDEVGMIEVVTNSNTIANIQGGVRAALADDPIAKWLRSNNPSEETYTRAVDNFLLSCAGYCVATYVLGIGDRHNDNIMVTKTGELFHIDFGHFLGNFKSKLGIKRERTKFILTPDFVYALSNGQGEKSEQFMKFKDKCKEAYLIVRHHANLFINLLNMMLCTGIPELKSHEDVNYLRQTLCLDITDDAAASSFMQEIDIALRDSWSVRLNWAAHIVAHK